MKMVQNFFFNKNNLKIINEDFLKTDLIEKDSVDLIITSPPYNVDIKYKSFVDNITYDKYLEFSGTWLYKCFSFF